MHKRIIGIGWDVGGWMGKKQGFAVCIWHWEEQKLSWPGKPIVTTLPSGHLLSPNDILRASGCSSSLIDMEDDNLSFVIAIDAPLWYPKGFINFIQGASTIKAKPESEITNPLAYRKPEQYIYRKFAKKPMSAPFDRIGNNATVAVTHVRKWESETGFVLRPSEKAKTEKAKTGKDIIEVYPALVKAEPEYRESFTETIPKGGASPADAFDAGICALLAIKYHVGKELFGLPNLTGPEGITEDYSEGWIYHI